MRARAALAPDHSLARARTPCTNWRLRARAAGLPVSPTLTHNPDKGGIRTMAQATKTTLRPLHDHVMIQRMEEDQTRHGSIIIPDSAKEKPQEGKVIAVGSGKLHDNGTKTPLDIKAGDRVLFGKYSGSEVKLDGEEYIIMKEADVLGVLGT